MPSRRSRSRSRSRDRSESPERRIDLPHGASPISESDYFQKNDEFRLWLKEEKRKYFDELSGDKARSYFRKFVKSWNRNKLPKTYYAGIAPGSMPATSNTSYKWSFASKAQSRAHDEARRMARAEVGAATYGQQSSAYDEFEDREYSSGRGVGGSSSSRPSGSGRVLGPAMPSASDLTLAQEMIKEQRDEERAYKRKREKLDTKDRIEDMVGPKPVGREGMLEKKRMKREGDRAFRERGDEGLELDESTLMGGGDSFRDQIAKRDMAKKRYEKKNEERINTFREKSTAFKEKEKATMDMFQQLAKQRFG